jgi:hypothetical protein
MKKLLFLSIVTAFLSTSISAQVTTPPASKAKMVFDNGETDTVLEYGKIQQNSEPLRKVKFKNTGTEPLVILSARGSCGCTVPTPPKDPILPGQTSEIEVRYATDRVGPFTKMVTVSTNEGIDHTIRVQGDVQAAPSKESVPVVAPSVLKSGK